MATKIYHDVSHVVCLELKKFEDEESLFWRAIGFGTLEDISMEKTFVVEGPIRQPKRGG
jgi:hypothetical protein